MQKQSFAVLLWVVLVPTAIGQSSGPVVHSFEEAAAVAPSPFVIPVQPVSPSGGPLGAQALTWYSSRSTFVAAITDLCHAEDWEESHASPVARHAEPLWVCTNDGLMSLGEVEGGLAVRSSSAGGVVTVQAGFIGQPSVVAGASAFFDFTILDFSNGPTAVGFDLFSTGVAPDPVAIRVFDPIGNLLGSMNVGAGSATTFVGVQLTAGFWPIGWIELESQTGNGEVVDNVVWNGHCQPILGPDRPVIPAGGTVRLAISEAVAPSRALLYVTSYNGAPFLLRLFAVNLPTGLVCLGPFTVPPSASGSIVGMRAFLIDAVQGVTATNTQTLILQ